MRRVRRLAVGVVGVVVAMQLALASTGVALATGGAPSKWPGGKWSPPPARYAVATVHDAPFVMSDGVTLIGDVFYPADLTSGTRVSHKFPVVLSVNPYNVGGFGGPLWSLTPSGPGNGPTYETAGYLTQHGYISVIVDARGTGRSGGSDAFLSPRAQQDGAELIQKVAHTLDGSDGRVALLGCSYLGEWAYMNAANAAKAGPSPVKAAVAECASGDFFREFFNVGGLMTTDWYFIEHLFAASDASPGTSQPGTAVSNVPDHAGSLTGHYATAVPSTATGGDLSYDGTWWNERSPIYRAQDIVANHIPVLDVTADHDLFPAGALGMISALQNLQRGQPEFGPVRPDASPLSPRYQIIMGPGGHASGLSDEITLEWMETWVKGVDTGMQETDRPLHLWEDAATRWIDANSYPVVRDYTPLYLAGAGGLSHSRSAGGDGADSLAWQPEQSGALLTYTSTPFASNQLLVGPSAAVIYASSMASDVELVATLLDVAQDGTATPVAKSGALLGSQRAEVAARSWVDGKGLMVFPYHPVQQSTAQPVPPGEVVRYDIEIPPTVWLVPSGHRLQFKLTSQLINGSFGSVNGALTLVPTPQQAAALAGGTYAIQRNSSHASMVDVPLMPETSACTSPFAWAPAPQDRSTALAGAPPCEASGSPSITSAAPALPDTSTRAGGAQPLLVLLPLLVLTAAFGIVHPARFRIRKPT